MQIGRYKRPVRILHFEDEADCIAGVLRLFRNAGLELSEQEFRTLLLLRRQTDQILLHKEA